MDRYSNLTQDERRQKIKEIKEQIDQKYALLAAEERSQRLGLQTKHRVMSEILEQIARLKADLEQLEEQLDAGG